MTNGIGMMLKSFGVDPKMFEQVGQAVQEIVATLRRIEEHQKNNEKLLLSLFQKIQETQNLITNTKVLHAGR